MTVTVREDIFSATRALPADTRIVRVPADMEAMTASVEPLDDESALVFWAGWRKGDGDRYTGRVCRYMTLQAARDLVEFCGTPLRVLVPGGPGDRTWAVAEVIS